MPVYAIFGIIASFPAAFIIWIGMVSPFKNEDGTSNEPESLEPSDREPSDRKFSATLDYQILKRKLNRIVLPICSMLLIPWVIFLATTLYGSISAYGLATIWGAAIPTIGIYGSMLLSAKLLDTKGKLTKGIWLLLTLLFMVILAWVGIYILFLLSGIGDTLDSLF